MIPGTLPGGRSYSRAMMASADGSIIAGSCYTNTNFGNELTFRWSQAGGMQGLGTLLGFEDSNFPNAISSDGAVIVGTSYSATGSSIMYRWTQSGGLVALGNVPNRYTSHTMAMSANGTVIVGAGMNLTTTGDFIAFIWDSAHGIRILKDVLQSDYGLNLTGWTLQQATCITPNGNVIVGQAINPSGQQEAFRVVLDTRLTDIKKNESSIPKNILLNQNYPNPFDYLGEKQPGDTAKIFANNFISRGDLHGRLAISPDGKEVLWTSVNFKIWTGTMLRITKKDGKWSSAETPSFAMNGTTDSPLFSPDGKKLFYNYRKSVDSSYVTKYVEKTDAGWSEPKNKGFLFKPGSSFTSSGKVYFSSTMNGKPWNTGIYCAQFSDTGLTNIEPLPATINLPDVIDYTPYIAPDESYLLFSSNRPMTGTKDLNMYLYISFKNNGKWSTPQKINSAINFPGKARFPSISPDGKYLFFCGDDRNYYWVDINVIKKLNPINR